MCSHVHTCSLVQCNTQQRSRFASRHINLSSSAIASLICVCVCLCYSWFDMCWMAMALQVGSYMTNICMCVSECVCVCLCLSVWVFTGTHSRNSLRFPFVRALGCWFTGSASSGKPRALLFSLTIIYSPSLSACMCVLVRVCSVYRQHWTLEDALCDLYRSCDFSSPYSLSICSTYSVIHPCCRLVQCTTEVILISRALCRWCLLQNGSKHYLTILNSVSQPGATGGHRKIQFRMQKLGVYNKGDETKAIRVYCFQQFSWFFTPCLGRANVYCSE